MTNEGVAEALRSHAGEHLFDFSEVDDLPSHSRIGRTAAQRAALAERVLLPRMLVDRRLCGTRLSRRYCC